MAERTLTRETDDQLKDDDAEGRPRDVGRTSGGGSLGHKQPQDVAEKTGIRNQPDDHRRESPAQGDLQR
jgi:hypothetical protein